MRPAPPPAAAAAVVTRHCSPAACAKSYSKSSQPPPYNNMPIKYRHCDSEPSSSTTLHTASQYFTYRDRSTNQRYYMLYGGIRTAGLGEARRRRTRKLAMWKFALVSCKRRHIQTCQPIIVQPLYVYQARFVYIYWLPRRKGREDLVICRRKRALRVFLLETVMHV